MAGKGSLQKGLIIQHDGTILLEKKADSGNEIGRKLSRFAQRVRETEHLVTFRLTPFTLWQAAASGMPAKGVLEWLRSQSKFPLAGSFVKRVEDAMERFGQIRLERRRDDSFALVGASPSILPQILAHLKRETMFNRESDRILVFSIRALGTVKQACIAAGYPPLDQIGFAGGESLSFEFAEHERFSGLRPYQLEAVDAYFADGAAWFGGGVIVLPCGAGKSVVALAIMQRIGKATLILTPNSTSAKQWVREILDKTSLSPDDVGEYTATTKQIRPVTVTTYQMLTHRDGKEAPFQHLELLGARDFGFVIYDEVHLLPAPVFRITADLQAKRRLGLTATFVREDGKEEDVFSLVGPKLYEGSWKELEESGWISEAVLREIRVPFSPELETAYMKADPRQKVRLAAENPRKIPLIEEIMNRHEDEQILIIGQYLRQLEMVSDRYGFPLITGSMPTEKREEWYRQFRERKIRVLIVSKVANMAVDLPDASVAIQISGTFGSRQEEAQRLGRILRVKETGRKAYFYHLVTKDSVDQEYAWHRQSFLAEQGYRYEVMELEREVQHVR
jgi:DNA excision repair protein ERCC-3